MMRPTRSIRHLMLLLMGLTASFRISAAEDFTISKTYYESGGKDIRVDVYHPTKPGVNTPVMVLHGSGGVIFDGPEMKKVARVLALAGHDVYVVHYFNRTGHPFVMGRGLKPHFETWLEAVHDGVRWITVTRNDGQKVGIFGYSLGAFLAVSEAAHDPLVGAVVSHSGGIWKGQDHGVKKVAPLRIIHGRKDETVPFDVFVPPMQALAKKHQAAAETSFYGEEGHRFLEPALIKVRQEVAEFFGRRLWKRAERGKPGAVR